MASISKLISILNEREKGGGDKGKGGGEKGKAVPAKTSFRIDEADPEARQKASAVIQYAKPMLNEALRQKNPEVFDAWENKRREMLAESIAQYKSGNAKAAMETEKRIEDYVQNTPMELYLNPEEIKGVLGDQYDAFQEAMKVNNRAFAQRNVAGVKEVPNVRQMEDVAYGKRMMTQQSLSSDDNMNYQYYNPATKSFERRNYKDRQAGKYK
jgi:hypothetical protein